MTDENACEDEPVIESKPPGVIHQPLSDDRDIPRVKTQFRAPQSPTLPRIGPATNATGANTPEGKGHIKAPPICRVIALRKENMSAEQLSQWCFDPDDILVNEKTCRSSFNDNGELKLNTKESIQGRDQVLAGSSGQKYYLRVGHDSRNDRKRAESSHNTATCSSGNNNINRQEDVNRHDKPVPMVSPKEWASFKRTILKRTESRNGRDLQKFARDPQTGNLLRLTTGAVPIMSDGRILLVSSSRKEEWILPKGGWESDETIEGSALRETFEEGGILGILGPRLTQIEYETRKAKKKRLEMESLMKKKYEIAYATNLSKDVLGNANQSSANSTQSANSSLCQSEDDPMQCSGHSNNKRTSALDRADDTASLGSIASIASDMSLSCGHVRMCMFPLYVLEVRENWPESGRARKAVDIDTAINIMTSRPEFHKVLIEVKKRGLHLT